MINTGAPNIVVQAADESVDESEDSSDECGHDNKYQVALVEMLEQNNIEFEQRIKDQRLHNEKEKRQK